MTNRKNHTCVAQMVNIALFAAIITVCSQITIKLPTAVPVTLQTAGVCMAAALLGPLGGTASVAVYIMLGAFGLPVFSGFSGGIGHIYGPTGGFIMGFLPAAFLTGLIVKRYGNRLISLIPAMISGVAVCYLTGCLWYAVTTGVSLKATFLACVLPFIRPDAVKIVLSALVCRRLAKHIKKK